MGKIGERKAARKSLDFEASARSLSEELEALAKARTVLSEKTGSDESFIYGLTQISFFQLSGSVLSFRGGLAKFEAFQEDLRKCEERAFA